MEGGKKFWLNKFKDMKESFRKKNVWRKIDKVICEVVSFMVCDKKKHLKKGWMEGGKELYMKELKSMKESVWKKKCV